MNEREQKWKGKNNGGNKKEEIKTKNEEKGIKKCNISRIKLKKNSSGVINPPALTQNKILMAFTPLHLP